MFIIIPLISLWAATTASGKVFPALNDIKCVASYLKPETMHLSAECLAYYPPLLGKESVFKIDESECGLRARIFDTGDIYVPNECLVEYNKNTFDQPVFVNDSHSCEIEQKADGTYYVTNWCFELTNTTLADTTFPKGCRIEMADLDEWHVSAECFGPSGHAKRTAMSTMDSIRLFAMRMNESMNKFIDKGKYNIRVLASLCMRGGKHTIWKKEDGGWTISSVPYDMKPIEVRD